MRQQPASAHRQVSPNKGLSGIASNANEINGLSGRLLAGLYQEDRILKHAASRDPVDPRKLHTAVRYLYVIFRQVHILDQSYGRQLPSRDLTTLFASIWRIKQRLHERDF